MRFLDRTKPPLLRLHISLRVTPLLLCSCICHSNSACASPQAQAGRSTVTVATSSATTVEQEPGRVSVNGLIVASKQATLSVRFPSLVSAVTAHENGLVRRGDLLVQLDDSEARTQLASARAALQAAKIQESKATTGRKAQQTRTAADISIARAALAEARSKLSQAELALKGAQSESDADIKGAEQQIDKARIGLETATHNAADLEILNKAGGVSRNDLEGARTQVKLAKSDLAAAQLLLSRAMAGPEGVPFKVAMARKDLEAAKLGVSQAQQGLDSAVKGGPQALAVAEEDIKSARAAVAQAYIGLSGAGKAVASLRLTSPIDGVTTVVAIHPGETAQPGAPLIVVVSAGAVHAEALIPSRYLSQLKIGAHATLIVDTLPGRTLDATVSEISPIAEPDQRSIRVKFRTTSSAGLRPGLAVRISFGAKR